MTVLAVYHTSRASMQCMLTVHAAVVKHHRAARLIRASSDLGLDTGLLLAVPIPESAAAEGAAIQQAIQDSLQEADAKGIAGAEVGYQTVGTTPTRCWGSTAACQLWPHQL